MTVQLPSFWREIINNQVSQRLTCNLNQRLAAIFLAQAIFENDLPNNIA